ncbi:hypothetical protein [Actinomadura sp. 6N118]|uniref:hypothetical protein n=1 Tax=Actinomadura sp. 6N118 TaxID=3375151 RepID=UPI0037A80288
MQHQGDGHLCVESFDEAACWDGIGGLYAYIVLSIISISWLLWELHRSRTLPWWRLQQQAA